MVDHNCKRVRRASTGKKRAVRARRGGAMARTVEGVTRELEQVHNYPCYPSVTVVGAPTAASVSASCVMTICDRLKDPVQ
eukprot:5890937-Prymnesium_polylepis.1